jgi:hypothetical protein
METFRVGLPFDAWQKNEAALVRAGWKIVSDVRWHGEHDPTHVLIAGSADDAESARQQVTQIVGLNPLDLHVLEREASTPTS